MSNDREFVIKKLSFIEASWLKQVENETTLIGFFSILLPNDASIRK